MGSGSGIAIGRRRGWDPTLMWLWYRLAATAPIQPLAWECPYAVGTALERPKKKKNFFLNTNFFFSFCLYLHLLYF